MGSIIVLGRSPGVGNDSLLQYSCWETPWTEELDRLLSLELQRVDTTEHTHKEHDHDFPLRDIIR